MPVGPSMQVLRTSRKVGATTAHSEWAVDMACSAIQFDPTQVLWVGIMASPARNMELRLSTVRQRIGFGSIRCTETIIRWWLRSDWAPPDENFAIFRGRRNTWIVGRKFTRHFGPQSRP